MVDNGGMLSQMELQMTMQSLLEGASYHSENTEEAESEALRIRAEKENERRRQEIEVIQMRLQEQEADEEDERKGRQARLAIILKRWRMLTASNRRRRIIAVRAVHLRRMLPFLNGWLKAVDNGKKERVEVAEEERRCKIADRFRRLFLLNVILVAWREVVAEEGQMRHHEAQIRVQEETEEKEVAAKEVLAHRFHRLFVLHHCISNWSDIAKAGREERERLKLEALRKERIASLLSKIAAKAPSQIETDGQAQPISTPSQPATTPLSIPAVSLAFPLAAHNRSGQPLQPQAKRPPSASTTKPCAPRLSTALRAEERKKSILEAGSIKQPMSVCPNSPVATLITATPSSLEISQQTTPGKTFEIIRTMKRQLKQVGGSTTVHKANGSAPSNAPDSDSEPWGGAYDETPSLCDGNDEPEASKRERGVDEPETSRNDEPEDEPEAFRNERGVDAEISSRPNTSRPRTSSSSISSNQAPAPSSFGSKAAILRAPSFDPRPPVSSRRTSSNSVASSYSARSDMGSMCSSASAMERRREMEEALIKAKAAEAQRRRKMTAKLVEVEGAFEKEAQALSSLHYHRSLLMRSLRQWQGHAVHCQIEQPLISIRHHHRSLTTKSLAALSSAVQARKWKQVVGTTVGVASLRLARQSRVARKCLMALSQWAMVSRFSRHHQQHRVMDSFRLVMAIGREKMKVVKIFHQEWTQRSFFISWRQAAEELGSRKLLSRLQEQHEQDRKAGLVLIAYCFKRWRASLPELRVDRQASQRAHAMRSKVNGWLTEMRAKRNNDDELPLEIDLRLDI